VILSQIKINFFKNYQTESAKINYITLGRELKVDQFVLFASEAALTGVCQHAVRTRLSSCRKMPDFTAHDVWHPIICLKIQNMTVKEPVVFYYCTVSVYLFTLYI